MSEYLDTGNSIIERPVHSGDEMVQKLNDLACFLPSATEYTARMKLAYGQKAAEVLIELMHSHKGGHASLIKQLAEHRCAKEDAEKYSAERMEKNIIHTMESLRTMISREKSERELARFGS